MTTRPAAPGPRHLLRYETRPLCANGVEAEGRYEDVSVAGDAVFARRQDDGLASTELSDVLASLDLASRSPSRS